MAPLLKKRLQRNSLKAKKKKKNSNAKKISLLSYLSRGYWEVINLLIKLVLSFGLLSVTRRVQTFVKNDHQRVDLIIETAIR